jgi:hypothetical protein
MVISLNTISLPIGNEIKNIDRDPRLSAEAPGNPL